MSIKEILEELPKLTPEERQEIRDFLDAEEFPETDELIKSCGRGFSVIRNRAEPFCRGS